MCELPECRHYRRDSVGDLLEGLQCQAQETAAKLQLGAELDSCFLHAGLLIRWIGALDQALP